MLDLQCGLWHSLLRAVYSLWLYLLWLYSLWLYLLWQARSTLPQDQHNSRIHAARQLEAELKLREVP